MLKKTNAGMLEYWNAGIKGLRTIQLKRAGSAIGFDPDGGIFATLQENGR